MKDFIYVKGAKENNLKNIDVSIPRNQLVVFTGLSGSGKSSLAFDTIFAEGQRRYMESLSSYARQFLGQMEKPNVELIEGLSPAISIDQKTTSKNPRSTVGTVTEIYDYFRLLYARIGIPHCPNCGKPITSITIDQIVDNVMSFDEGSKVLILAPIARGRKGEYQKEFANLKKAGYVRVKIDGEIFNLEEEIKLDKNIKHTIYIVIDRLIIKAGLERRLTDSVENALKMSEGLIVAEINEKEILYSTKYSCPDCDISISELSPRMFSFNSPFGACEHCTGLGFKQELDPKKLIKDENLSLSEGVFKAFGWNMDGGKISEMQFSALAKKYNFSLTTPFKDLPEKIKNILFYGSKGEKLDMVYESVAIYSEYKAVFEGLINNLSRRYSTTTSELAKLEIEKLMTIKPCEHCGGRRLKKEILAVTINGRNIYELTAMPIGKLYSFLIDLELTDKEKLIAKMILKEINERLKFLIDVGLNYLTLSRSSATLSGGESQRIRLATQIGSGLMGVLYILDEPSIGLHQRDNDRLLKTLRHLRDLGNTLIVVEHDEDTIKSADYIVDIGREAGEKGGNLVFSGSYQDLLKCEESITADYLVGNKKIFVPTERRSFENGFLSIIGAKQNNLKNINVDIPLGIITAITGVSGSGKSSLINGILYPHLANKLNGASLDEGKYTEITGLDRTDKVIAIDQSPIGRTPRSNPATYTGVFAPIRELFAQTKDAKARGYQAGRFSFNVKGGRCENCSGDGMIKIEMHFLPDVYVPCEICGSRRYNRETLEVKYKGKSISEVLNMTVDEAVDFFENVKQIYNKIKTMQDVGLGYIRLGQSSTTLSGGEAQRVKLATELSKRATGKTVYILDEPTTGLHFADVDKLVTILNRLVSSGNTIIIIEHNLDIIKIADFIIDLGKEGGDGGGEIIVTGTPEIVAQCEESYTGKYLKRLLYKD